MRKIGLAGAMGKSACAGAAAVTRGPFFVTNERALPLRGRCEALLRGASGREEFKIAEEREKLDALLALARSGDERVLSGLTRRVVRLSVPLDAVENAHDDLLGLAR